MKTYEIKYTNNKNENIIAKSRGENAEEAFYKYANRPVFGRHSIFCNTSLKMYDADTRGEKWATFTADDISVTVSVI